jgi:invasion protein IalB|tara:strand:+ start:193 stop:450 length:258 start_codon:yes stop_codon:yes gene_type:complete
MNIKPLAEAQDIQASPSTGTLTSGTLAWVVNAHTAANKVTIAGAVPTSVVIPPNTGIIIDKEAAAVLDVTTSGGEVWATAIAYTN